MKRDPFKQDRYGGAHSHPSASRGRLTYMVHAKGYVMVRRPGRIPFVITEKLWLSFPVFDPEKHAER